MSLNGVYAKVYLCVHFFVVSDIFARRKELWLSAQSSFRSSHERTFLRFNIHAISAEVIRSRTNASVCSSAMVLAASLSVPADIALSSISRIAVLSVSVASFTSSWVASSFMEICWAWTSVCRNASTWQE